ncbi:histidine phosphatase family protein [Aquisalimonas sp.]|uniref:histidine phosphatase family protein n=1 Tax=unclassified Aquisalimonas TaxID=2644645 RepID=UPI0025C652D1|nr:histidine phosphatase family protein [Aquisalimonas sp.]
MTELLLVRHGQAGFGTDNYDQLSALGAEQAAATGEHLRDIGSAPALTVSGDMVRQRDTAAIANRAQGIAPPPRIHPEFNEYDAGGIFEAFLDTVAAADAEVAAQRHTLHTDRRLFQRAFEGVMLEWLHDPESERRDVESWTRFRDRVVAGANTLIRDASPGETITLYTSGGVIAVLVGHALGLDADRTIALNWRVYNASVTRLRFGRRTGLNLMGFNAMDHLRLKGGDRFLSFR